LYSFYKIKIILRTNSGNAISTLDFLFLFKIKTLKRIAFPKFLCFISFSHVSTRHNQNQITSSRWTCNTCCVLKTTCLPWHVSNSNRNW